MWFESCYPCELDLTSFEISPKSREIKNSFQKISNFKTFCQKILFLFLTVFQKMALTMWSLSSEKKTSFKDWFFRSEWRILWGFRETKCTLTAHIMGSGLDIHPKAKVPESVCQGSSTGPHSSQPWIGPSSVRYFGGVPPSHSPWSWNQGFPFGSHSIPSKLPWGK